MPILSLDATPNDFTPLILGYTGEFHLAEIRHFTLGDTAHRNALHVEQETGQRCGFGHRVTVYLIGENGRPTVNFIYTYIIRRKGNTVTLQRPPQNIPPRPPWEPATPEPPPGIAAIHQKHRYR